MTIRTAESKLNQIEAEIDSLKNTNEGRKRLDEIGAWLNTQKTSAKLMKLLSQCHRLREFVG